MTERDVTFVDTTARDDGARDKKFARDRWWFLRQVAVDRPHPLAVAVAVVFAEHANRASGNMHPSQATIGKILGFSERHVRQCIAVLVRRGHLLYVGRGPGHVKIYHWNLTDHRVEKRFDQVALGIAETGTRVPVDIDGNGPTKRHSGSASRSADREGKPARNGLQTGTKTSLNRNPAADKPCIEHESEPAAVPPLPNGSDERQVKRKRIVVTKVHEEDAAYLLNYLQPKIARTYCRRRWPVELAELEADGVPIDFIVAAFWRCCIERRLPDSVTSVKYFLPLARELMDDAAKLGDSWWYNQQGTLECAFIDAFQAAHERDPSVPLPQVQ